jgi:Cysteine rich repeat
MFRTVSLALFVAAAAASPLLSLAIPPVLAAETMSFENSTATLAESCGKDIEANCLGVSLDAPRLRECLSRNGDSVSPQCRADYVRAFDAIQKRVSSRYAVFKACERDKQKLCAETQSKPGETVACLLKAPAKSLGWVCNQALTQAGYR